jgi:glyoxylase-like metal-dependent hydrolase (beta-lactamase superfamily II)
MRQGGGHPGADVLVPDDGGVPNFDAIIHTPGHCAGQVALLWRPGRMLFAGDVCMNIMGLGDPIGLESSRVVGNPPRQTGSQEILDTLRPDSRRLYLQPTATAGKDRADLGLGYRSGS